MHINLHRKAICVCFSNSFMMISFYAMVIFLSQATVYISSQIHFFSHKLSKTLVWIIALADSKYASTDIIHLSYKKNLNHTHFLVRMLQKKKKRNIFISISQLKVGHISKWKDRTCINKIICSWHVPDACLHLSLALSFNYHDIRFVSRYYLQVHFLFQSFGISNICTLFPWIRNNVSTVIAFIKIQNVINFCVKCKIAQFNYVVDFNGNAIRFFWLFAIFCWDSGNELKFDQIGSDRFYIRIIIMGKKNHNSSNNKGHQQPAAHKSTNKNNKTKYYDRIRYYASFSHL